jgi:hypothetical protein
VRDLDGRSWTPLSPGRGETNLVFFIAAECPVTRRYSPEMDRIAAAYGKRGVRTWSLFADRPLPPADAPAPEELSCRLADTTVMTPISLSRRR